MSKAKQNKTEEVPGALHIESTEVIMVKETQTNAFLQNFQPGIGEVVVRFKNFTRKKKYFTVSVIETDSEGVRLKPETEEAPKV